METLQQLIPTLLAVSMAALVVGVGLDATLEDIVSPFRRPRGLLKAVLAVNVIVPIAAMVLVGIFPLNQASRAGILLMAISPAPPLVPATILKVSGRKSQAYGQYVALIVLAIVVVPAWVWLLGRHYGVAVSLSMAKVATSVLFTVLVPLAVGMVLHRLLGPSAAKAAKLVRAAATTLLLLVLMPMLIHAWPAVAGLVGDGSILVAALMVAAALIGGHVLGGPDLEERAALAVTAGTRHPGIALMIAGANAAQPSVSAAVILVLLVGVAAAQPYKIWVKRRGRAPLQATAS
jgi:BASS family bile acid:Na+ symporter